MIFGIGTDVVAVERIERMLEQHGEKAAEKLLASAEMADFHAAAVPPAFLAKRFAAKEALGKALGLGLRAPATLHNIAIGHDALGRPRFDCAPQLSTWLAERRLRAHLSITDEKDTAIAFVVVEQEEN